MKKLLLLNNLLLILSIGKCANDHVAKNTETQPVQDSLSAVADTTLTDSMTYAAHMDSLALDTMKPPISKEDKYKARPNKPKEAPKHNAPDQAKVDSLKAAKGKNKK